MKFVKTFKKSTLSNLEIDINSYVRLNEMEIVSVEFIFDGKDYVALVVFSSKS
ncbi:hypothetical protein [Acinetobacter baumannii]|uniref:hypothetical protein n=1 Tax=Acinetobacter baumannii TaxID=470 RepID=UPI001447E0B3|nr:hypothetical protein [Acinetobacter baumannii]MDC5271049.1 hypothetical protein [Acinetobacter baumannii]NLH05769.1 hypothetical protein [Acinetobacter baumannii]